MNIQRRRLLQIAVTAPAAYAAQPYAQSPWPDKPIRFVVGYPASQSVDTIARNFAVIMGRELGQNIIIDNRAGANGILGAQEVKTSRPDGYTILIGTSGQLAINPGLYRKLPYDTLKDFAPVGLMLVGPLFLVANPSFPPNNVQELLAYARKQPGKIDFGSGGNGITAHLGMELLQEAAGIKLNHIPYKGSPAALNDLMGGQIPLMMESGPAALPHVKAGKLKVLGSSSIKRAAAFPGVATIAEQGVPGFDVTAWNGMVVPAGTPKAIIDKLNASMRKACADPLILDMLRAFAGEATPNSPGEFGTFLGAEITKWRKAVVRAGAQVD